MSWLDERLEQLKPQGKNKSGLARALGVAPSRITEIGKGLRQIQSEEWPLVARYLEWKIDELHLAVEGQPLKSTQFQPLDMQEGTSDLPVLFCNISERGTLEVEHVEVDRVERPPILRYSNNAFALWIKSGEQSPAFELRDTILVDPNRPVAPGDDVLAVRNFSLDGRKPFEGLVRRFVGETEKHWLVQQFKPPREYKLAKADWPRLLCIAGKYSR